MLLVSLAPGVQQRGGRRVSERALVALITSGIVVAASRACALDESISKEQLVVLAVRLVGRFQPEEAVVVQVEVDLLRDTARELSNLAEKRSTHSVCSDVEVRPNLSKPISNHLQSAS